MDDRGPLDLERQIEELSLRLKYVEQDNLYQAKEIDRLNEYVQEMELKEISRKLWKKKNNALRAEVNDLKKGTDAIEERAREELGMIKKGETYFQVINKAKQ